MLKYLFDWSNIVVKYDVRQMVKRYRNIKLFNDKIVDKITMLKRI